MLELSQSKARALHVVYNNCHGNYAVTNAAELSHRLLAAPGPARSPRDGVTIQS